MFLLGDIVSLSLLIRLGVAALLWVLFHLLIRFHPRGIEIVGAILLFLGLIWWFIEPVQKPPFGPMLLMTGFTVHALGRLLHWMRS